MQNTFGFTNTQIGVLLSTYGIMSLVGYIPGGWLADRLPPRRLITVALLITSAGGFVFSTIPSFEVCVLLYGIWGLATSLVFWSAMIKATRNWARKEEQGRAYGILEGGRSITDLVSATALLAIFAFRGGDYLALTESIVLQASVPLVLAIVVWLLMKDDKARNEEPLQEQSAITFQDLNAVIRMPVVWLLAIIIMAAYSGYWVPVLVEEFRIRRGSGGSGKWRGGDGTIRTIKVLEAMEMSILSSHRNISPPGLAGGKPGAQGVNRIIRQDGTLLSLEGCDHRDLKAGDIIQIETPGGGGFGKE